MARSRWWSRSRGLPSEVYDGWRTSVPNMGGKAPTVLAWAESENGHVVASPAVLSVSDGEHWRHVGWHEIENGGWNGETRKLSWSRYPESVGEGSRHGSALLTAPGRLPETFRERVAASIVVERFLPVSGERGVVLHGRRRLAVPDEPALAAGPGEEQPVVSWHATLGRGLSWRTPGLREAVDETLAELRSEYDPGQVR